MPRSSRPVSANIDRLNSYMDRNGLAAVAVRTGVNFTYLAGMAMPGTLSRQDRKSTRLNSSHLKLSRMPSSA